MYTVQNGEIYAWVSYVGHSCYAPSALMVQNLIIALHSPKKVDILCCPVFWASDRCVIH